MQENAKTLLEMTKRERSAIMTQVAQALEVVAYEAQEIGDERFAANSICLARMIQGCTGELVGSNLAAAELLLQHGISLVASFPTEAPRVTTLH